MKAPSLLSLLPFRDSPTFPSLLRGCTYYINLCIFQHVQVLHESRALAPKLLRPTRPENFIPSSSTCSPGAGGELPRPYKPQQERPHPYEPQQERPHPYEPQQERCFNPKRYIGSLRWNRQFQGLEMISADLYPQERLVTQLGNWQRTLDPATYRRHVPWPPEVKAAYDEYKRLVHVFAQAREAFEEDRGRTATMPEEHLERARLAVAWGEAALRAAEGRLTFLDTYRNAYSGPESIKNHIKEGQNTINSGRRAVKEARTNYGKLWEKYNRQTDPRVFA
ncbi:hypothetical protein ATEIFO6365_0005034100 [Aspergillus terreus]|uniref:Uncharacterized protein n=1 Tax=Aspergillus terreus TaxID=33178 RepID=A0A5M3Z4S8_ASPTE|nr:hypothetical protein ATETN484_0007034600 [Aspergillus terreus]GFF16151.1 hypothetical protein ATEIFO6365_0005034100 [Aspergillus terreus]